MAELTTNDPGRRAVLRVSHDVDEAGRVIQVQLEPLPDAPHDDVACAAYHAAVRSAPWIVGDEAAGKLEAARRVAVERAGELLRAAGEVLFAIDQVEPPAGRRADEHWRGGYRSALEDLRASDAFQQLRDTASSLRGDLAALQGTRPPAPAAGQPLTGRPRP